MKANLLAGNPITVDFFQIYPWKLRDIVNSELEYQKKLFVFLIDKEHFDFPTELTDSYDILQLIKLGAVLTESFRNQVLEALKAFTHKDFIFTGEEFILDDNVLKIQHWEQIRTILVEENYIDLTSMKKDKKYESKLSPQAIAFRKRITETRAMVEKYKKTTKTDLAFLINHFCARSHNISLLNVWDLTYYQFRKQLDAIMAVEKYDFDMAAAANGLLDLKKHKIIHWTENN